ncbi:MAG: cell division protein ZapE [Rhodomicrobium sp.]
MTESLLQRYRRLLSGGKIAPDSAQALAVEKLQMLTNRLDHYTPPARTDFFSFFTRRRGEVPKGLYIFGAVGRGKTMLMDLFFGAVAVKQKRRAHFHEFMAEVHARLGAARREAKEDPILAVGKAIASEAQLLCLDELFVIDIADATILHRLFRTFFEAGTVVVVTSNAHPRELYKDGRNRDLFLPFIDLAEENMELLQLEASRDYRLEQLGDSALYFSPLGRAAQAAMDDLWRKLTFGEPCRREMLTVLDHDLPVPSASFGAARFAFADLFEKPLGASDYIALARHYHTIFVDGIPAMDSSRRNEARRFITFIDTLYDHRTGFIASAEAEPEALYRIGDGAAHFERTASRLIEMRSAKYLRETLSRNAGRLQREEPATAG